MVKIGWSLSSSAVCFDKFMRTVRVTPTLRMETSNGPKKDLFEYLRRCKAAATTRCRISPKELR